MEKYKVQIGFGENRHYGLDRDMFAEGERVEFSFPVATDTSYRVTSNDVERFESKYEDGMFRYWFTMPDHDVSVSVNSNNTMVNPNYNGGGNANPMSFMGGGFMSMHDIMSGKIPTGTDEGKPKAKLFCPECGEKLLKEGQKFCQNCGKMIG